MIRGGSKFERFCGTSQRVKLTVGFKAEEIISGRIDGGEGVGVDDRCRFAFDPFSRVKGFFLYPFSYLFLVSEREEEFRSITKYIGKKIRGKSPGKQRYVHVGGNRWKVRPSYSYLPCISVFLFIFFFSRLIISIHG